MRSALECFIRAARCEEMARASSNNHSRSALLETAKIWRKLGEHAEQSGSSRGSMTSMTKRLTLDHQTPAGLAAARHPTNAAGQAAHVNACP